jgi:hypothetical protein
VVSQNLCCNLGFPTSSEQQQLLLLHSRSHVHACRHSHACHARTKFSTSAQHSCTRVLRIRDLHVDLNLISSKFALSCQIPALV